MASVEHDNKNNCGLERSNIIEILEGHVNKLYDLRDFYFQYYPVEEASLKHDRLKEKLEDTITLLNENSEAAVRENKAKYLYLLGRAHDVAPIHSKVAEDALTKAIKLNPKLVEAWNQLGECYWKRDNRKEAKNCFERALSQLKNKFSLRNLSVVIRHESTNSLDEKVVNIEQGIEFAKQAVAMDMSDGDSWYVLGNAHISHFFMVQQNPKALKLAMAAYIQAEKRAGNNPSLFYNKAITLKYEEEYESAIDMFSKSSQLDPMWKEPINKRQQLISYLDNTVELINSKGRLKAKKIQSLLQGLDESKLGSYRSGKYISPGGQHVKLDFCKLAQLKPGINEHVVVLGNTIGSIWDEDGVPFTFCLMDKEKTVFAVTVYNLVKGKGVNVGDTVAIPEPYLSVVNFTNESKEYVFSSIRVDNPIVMVVNNKKLGMDKLASAQLKTFKYSY